MEVKSSLYIKENKSFFRELVDTLLKEYEYASVLVCDARGKTYAVSGRGVIISESFLTSSRGYVVKVYDKGSFAEYSGNIVAKEEIAKIVKTIKEELITLGSKSEKTHYEVPADEAVSFAKSTSCEIDPFEMGDEKIIAEITKIREEGIAMDEKVLDVSVITGFSSYSKLFLSRNKDLEQNIMWTQGNVRAMCRRDEQVKTYFNSCSNMGGMELLETMKASLKNVVTSTIELLDSTNIEPGEYECICTPEVTGMIVHEAFGHGVEMDMFVKDRALAKYNIGEYVAAPCIDMVDGNQIEQTGTYFFDDEGTLSGNTVIIDKGVLQTGISDLQSAMALGTKPTGNGRRESYKRKAYTRMTNTYFKSGNDKLEDMIASIKYGFWLENPFSGMEDPKNWGIQLMVNIAREIKDGKLTGRVFSPIVMTGYVPDLLKSISMVSDESFYCGSGYCGKGYKEYVKVSDGGPYIKANIRLG